MQYGVTNRNKIIYENKKTTYNDELSSPQWKTHSGHLYHPVSEEGIHYEGSLCNILKNKHNSALLHFRTLARSILLEEPKFWWQYYIQFLSNAIFSEWHNSEISLIAYQMLPHVYLLILDYIMICNSMSVAYQTLLLCVIIGNETSMIFNTRANRKAQNWHSKWYLPSTYPWQIRA